MRRKGEKKLERTWPDWDCGWHPVRRLIDDGDRWFAAWTFQAATPWVKLTKASKMPIDRLSEIDRGDQPTPEEIDGLAMAWNADPSQVATSIAYAAQRLDSTDERQPG